MTHAPEHLPGPESSADGPYTILGRILGPPRRRGWVRPGLTVHLAKYDRMTRAGDVGCYHVLRADGVTLCGRDTHNAGWRDAGWADSEVICCKLCGEWVWRRWVRDGVCDGVAPGRAHSVTAQDDWPSRLNEAGRQVFSDRSASTTLAPPAAPPHQAAGRRRAPAPAAGRCGGRGCA